MAAATESDGWDAELRARVPKYVNLTASASGEFHWRIDAFGKLPTRATSPEFTSGGFRWQLLMHPQGNPASTRKGSVALFLNCLGPVDGAEDWHVCAAFALALSNPRAPSVRVVQQAHHRFTPRVSDWGYDEFVRMRAAFVPARGQPAPLIAKDPESDELYVEAAVALDIIDDETGVLWHDFQDYDSKQATGFTGLVNQGATCYLNSLLQSLYFTTAFRNAVYQIPDSSGVTGGLQRLFYQLRTSHPPVDTTDLTATFGWNTADAFTQHDVQELARILMDRLEAKMKGTAVDGFLSKLFVGQMVSYIKCLNVPFESSVTENFWDVQLNVKGLKDVYASFDDYCQTETLEGDNQYAAGEYGLQDAIKGVRFESLPPVLHLQLKRYDFNWEQNVEVKINDRYEFPLDLDLSRYVERPGPWQYALHGVLVHSGDLNVGHYYALIKPGPQTGWFRFDDDRVTKASLREVLEENFGGDQGTPLRRVTSAYMLVYVRVDSLDFVLASETAQPPPEIARMVEAEQRADELRRRELVEQRQTMRVCVFRSEHFRYHSGRGYFSRPRAAWGVGDAASLSLPRPVRVHAGLPFAALYRDLGAQSLFLAYRSVDAVEDARAPLECMIAVPNSREVGWASLRERARGDIPVVFVPPEFPESELAPNEYRLLFVKMFDENANVPRGVGVFWVPAAQPLGDFLVVRLGLRAAHVMLEILTDHAASDVQSLVLPLDAASTPQELALKDADIIVVSRDAESIKNFYDGVARRVKLELTPYRSPLTISAHYADIGTPAPATPAPEYEKVELTVNISDEYPVVAAAVASAVNARDPSYIQLHTAFPRWSADTALKSNVHPKYIWAQTQASRLPMQFRKLEMPLGEFEQLLEVGVIFLPDGTMGPRDLRVFLGKPEEVLTVGRMAEAVPGVDPNRIVCWTVKFHKNVVELHERTFKELDAMRKNMFTVFAAQLPPSELDARKQSDLKCEVIHFTQEPLVPHGIPFKLTLLPRETFAATKKRLLSMLHSSGEGDSSGQVHPGLGNVVFALINLRRAVPSVIVRLSPERDDRIILHDIMKEGCCLGLLHGVRASQELQSQTLRID